MLFLFLVKGLFKRHRTDLSELTEISEREQPELYAFIRRLCRELKAPFPNRIFLDPGVNAAVIYDTSLLSLVIPPKKHLLIGLGLVNVVNTSEFKAVLAHEFGHFTQSSLAAYVGIVNQVMGDLVWGRDGLDDALEEWKELDFRISAFVFLLSGILWIIRQFLAGIFILVTLVRLAFTRQREFHADRVAVSVAGSDAIVNSLARLEFAQEALGTALADLELASHQGLYSRDIYHHQLHSAERLRKLRRDPTLGQAPVGANGSTSVFSPVTHGHTSLGDSHPSLSDRERSAKRRYVSGPEVGVSPWHLFRDPESVRAHATLELYGEHLTLPVGVNLLPPEQVQARLDGGRVDATFDDKYQGLYDGRFLEPGHLGQIVQTVTTTPMAAPRLAQVCDRLYGGGFKERLDQNRQRRKELELLSAIDAGVRPKGKTFPFRGRDRDLDEAKTLLRMVEHELNEDRTWFGQIDREVFAAHHQMAERVQPGWGGELWARYHFHLGAQEVVKETRQALTRLNRVVGSLQAARQIRPEEMMQAGAVFREARQALLNVIAQAQSLTIPELPEVRAGTTLSQLVQPSYVVNELGPQEFPDPQWVESLARQLREAHDRAEDLLIRSLGAILPLQERIAAAWRASV